jgi:hypothetical protein
MSVVKAAITGAAFFAGIAVSVSADAACRVDTGECQQPSQYFAARSNPTATSTSSNITLPEVTVAAPYSYRALGPRVSSFAATEQSIMKCRLILRLMSNCILTGAAWARGSGAVMAHLRAAHSGQE